MGGLLTTTDGRVALAIGVGALLAVLTRVGWGVLRHVVTIAHEAGHALVAVLARRRLAGIRLHSDSSGLTVSRGRPSGPGMVATLAAGYPAPAVLGLLFAWLSAGDHITALLCLAASGLLGTLIAVRNAFGVLSVLLTAVAVLAVIRFGGPLTRQAFADAASWLLLLGGVRTVSDLQHERRRGRGTYSDADQLARLTRVPGLAWVVVFQLLALVALLAGGRWLLGL